MFNKNRPRAKKSSPTPLWEHRLPVTALALSGKGGATKSDKQLLKKHTLKPEIALLNQFPAQKALFKVPKICNINFWIENDPPPPLALFQKFIRFGCRTLPLEGVAT